MKNTDYSRLPGQITPAISLFYVYSCISKPHLMAGEQWGPIGSNWGRTKISIWLYMTMLN